MVQFSVCSHRAFLSFYIDFESNNEMKRKKDGEGEREKNARRTIATIQATTLQKASGEKMIPKSVINFRLEIIGKCEFLHK